MKPCRIQYPGVSATLLVLLLLSVSILQPSRLCAQPCYGTQGSFSYDTVVIRTDPQNPTTFDYNVPQFPASNLSLFAVTIRSRISVNPKLTIRNTKGGTAGSSAIGIYRSDDAYNNVTNDDAFGTNTFNNVWHIPTMLDNDQTTLTALNSVIRYPLVYDSLTTADYSLDNGSYLGWNLQDYTYTTTTSLNMPNYYSVVAYSDTIRFGVTYFYCNPGTLATDVLDFTAAKQDNGTILLNWNTTNEQAGRKYKIQVCNDGASFADGATVDSDPVYGDASYKYSYPVDPKRSGKLYFRLRIVDESGAVHFSVIRIVDLDRGMQPVKKGFYLYPNPATDFVTLNIPGNGTTPWQVDLIAADGRLVQREFTTNTNTPRVNFRQRLAAGTYFVRAVSTTTGERYAASFVVR